MDRIGAVIVAAVLTALLAWITGVQLVFAATITVTTTADEFSDPGPGTGCSLREAIQAANANVAFGGCPAGSGAGNGADTINLPAGTYTLTRTGANEDLNATGDLDITSSIAIIGAGANSAILDGAASDRLLEVQGASAVLAISGVTIRNGSAGSNPGGGISNAGGTLSVSDSAFSSNSGRGGGAIRTWAGPLSVTNTSFASNSSSGTGGAIEVNSGTANVAGLLLTGNTATLGGGGVYSASTLTITGSSINGNTAPDGAGVYGAGGTLTISQTTIASNTASSRGGGIYHDNTGGVLIVTDSTISGNSSPNGGGIYHGIISSTLTNVTISGNSSARGGGILQLQGGMQISHSTLSSNSSTSSPGGALRTEAGTAFMRAAIFANSPAGSNCSVTLSFSFQTQGSNVADDSTCFGNVGADRVVGSVGLGSLAANGGSTQTHALQAGSPAIDAVQGSCTSNGSPGGTAITTDQRGSPRPADGDSNGSAICDAGAFERASGAAPSISSITNQTIDVGASTAQIPFTVNDADTPTSSLTVSASSNNQSLIPNGSIQLGGSGGSRTIRLTPAPSQHGSAIITVTVSDGALSASTTFTVTVTSVNHAPVAANDSYSADAGKQLVTTAGAGVLANDTDAEGSPLSIATFTNPGHGALNLAANGSFTYTPAPGFAGIDSFTYRASDGVAQSNLATVTISVAAPPCSPRTAVKVSTSIVAGKLQAALSVQPTMNGAPNRIVELRFGTIRNGRVVVNGQEITTGVVFPAPPGATTITVIVERLVSGQATMVPVTVVDECGSWPTFVGGGPGAGF